MKIFKSNTLAQYIQRFLIVFSVILLWLTFSLLESYQWQSANIVITMVIASLILIVISYSFKQRVLESIERALLHIEAIKMEDYTQYAKSGFPEGCTADLHQQLKELSHHLQSQKSRYDQHAFLLYQLIDQLSTPMMVFNKKLKLTYANSAFSLLYGQPWQMYRSASPKILGLIKESDGWKLPNKDEQWQISQSEFIDAGESHHLLVFTNIDSAVRASQQNAWQQIIRVIGHEIRNSLTPVSSLAESLMQINNTPREKQSLAVISERCQHLNDFISRYTSLSNRLDLNIMAFEPIPLIERLKTLFTDKAVTFKLTVKKLYADEIFLEQVLINLIKNADEAGASLIEITIEPDGNSVTKYTNITVKDNGHGFVNLDNLFVPLFTTKQEGQGIGLTFCRNIIEQHKGTINLLNHKNKDSTFQKNTSDENENSGVSVIIKIPNN